MLAPLFALILAEAPPSDTATVKTVSPAAATAPKSGKADPMDKVVCHTGETELGSLIPAKTRCMTRREWAQLTRDSQDAVRDTQRGGFATTSPQ